MSEIGMKIENLDGNSQESLTTFMFLSEKQLSDYECLYEYVKTTLRLLSDACLSFFFLTLY